MHEIKADEELKQKIISNVIKSNFKDGSHFFILKKTFTFFVVACSLTLVTMFGFRFIQDIGDTPKIGQYQTLFGGFVLTAYADGTPVEVKPNVNFLLGKYQLTMSSVPGFPIKIVCDEADAIHLKAGYGVFKLWTPALEVLDAGNRIDIKSGDTIYWSPIPDKDHDTAPTKITLEITAYKNNKVLGNSTIEIIKSDDNITYNGILK